MTSGYHCADRTRVSHPWLKDTGQQKSFCWSIMKEAVNLYFSRLDREMYAIFEPTVPEDEVSGHTRS